MKRNFYSILPFSPYRCLNHLHRKCLHYAWANVTRKEIVFKRNFHIANNFRRSKLTEIDCNWTWSRWNLSKPTTCQDWSTVKPNLNKPLSSKGGDKVVTRQWNEKIEKKQTQIKIAVNKNDKKEIKSIFKQTKKFFLQIKWATEENIKYKFAIQKCFKKSFHNFIQKKICSSHNSN